MVKQGLSEEDIKLQFITPAIENAGWDKHSQIRMEHSFTDGRLIGAGQRGVRKKADYVFAYKNQKLAIVEAKKESEEVTQGLEQVKDYAKVLNIRFVYATNGHGIYFF